MLVISTRLLQLPAVRRYRLPTSGDFSVGPWCVQHLLDPSGGFGCVLLGSMRFGIARLASRWGPGTGAWVLFCPACGNAVRALEEVPSGWRCRHCLGRRRRASTSLGRLEARVARATAPRRPGEPRWRWARRTALPAPTVAEIEAARSQGETRAAEQLGQALGVGPDSDAG